MDPNRLTAIPIFSELSPEEPTSAPVTISAVLPRVKPMPAAAQPE